jgi:hypothetical protein
LRLWSGIFLCGGDVIVVVTVDVVTADSKCGVDCGGYSGCGDPGDVGYGLYLAA